MDISVRHLKRLLSFYGLYRRKNYSNLQWVMEFIAMELEASGQMHGSRWLHVKCRKNGLNVTREVVRLILKMLDPEGVEIRQRKRLRRRKYASKGPNYCWHADGYDKLKPYGIAIHGCIDGFSRKIIWLKAHNSNNDPYIIGGYYLQSVKELGGCPFRVRTDFGTENGNMEVMQRVFRQDAPACFLYGSSQLNQRIESWWGILRRQCIQFWMSLFHELRDNGQFSGTFYEKDLIRLCFTDLIQVGIILRYMLGICLKSSYATTQKLYITYA